MVVHDITKENFSAALCRLSRCPELTEVRK